MNKKYSEIVMLFTDGVNAVNPSLLIEKNVLLKGNILSIKQLDNTVKTIDLSGYKNIFIIGAGKASVLMAKKLEEVLGNGITEGVVVTKYGFGKKLKKIKLLEAAHPVPDKNGIIATQSIIDLCKKAGDNDLIVNLLSGGASALLPSPVEGVSLEDKIEVTNQLLKSGANIEELNIVRGHLSKIKGGGLLSYIYPAKVLSLIISDVIGDKLEIIGSGITVHTKKDFKKCWNIIEKYNFQNTFPKSVISYLQNSEDSDVQQNIEVDNIILGNNIIALKKIKERARKLGYKTIIVDTKLEGEAKLVGEKIAKDAIDFANLKARKGVKHCLLYGGETTVTIVGNGKGGRNQELILAAAIALKGSNRITILSEGTDGNDGPTDAAGAVCNGDTIEKGNKRGLNSVEYLENNDSYNYFNSINQLLKISPTGTNVMDVQIVLIN